MNELAKEAWDSVSSGCDKDDQFLRHHWFEAWGNNNTSVEYSYFKDDADLVAILPHFIKKKGPINFLSLAGYYYPHRGIPNNGVSENNIQQIIASFDAIEGLAGVHLGPVKISDEFISTLVETLKNKNWKFSTSSMGIDFGREVPEVFDDYLSTISKKRRKKINNRRRKLEKIGEVEMVHHRALSAEEWRKIIGELEDVEEKAWISQSDLAFFIGNEKQNFWNDLVQDDWYAKAFNIWMIYLDKKPISFFSGLDLGEQRFVFASSYDQEYRDYGVGSLLEIELIRTTMEEDKVSFINNGQGDYGYKGSWGYDEFQEIRRYIAFPPTLIGRLAYVGFALSRLVQQQKDNLKHLLGKG